MQVPFGRYKGQDISVMATDTEYAKTQLVSEAIREAFPDLVAALREALNPNETPTPKPASPDKNVFISVNDFLIAYCVVAKNAEVEGAIFYADYQAFCHSRQLEAVNPTAFSVRVMNVYTNRGVERDEVMRDGRRVEIYKGLTLKSPTQRVDPTSKPSAQPVHDFLPDVPVETEPPKAAPTAPRAVSEPKRQTEPIPIKDLSREDLVAAIGELEAEINATPNVIDHHWGDVELRVELRALEAQAEVIRNTPDIDDWHELMFDARFKNRQWVTLLAEEMEYYRVNPEDEEVERS
ncbi:MAG: hypothetical protein O7E52_24090 [Candidatus Poribacteria bacterium]|nr:hypothetical protein [Candidatus Poribacteria bacterium]